MLIDGFNKACKNITASYLKFGNKYMNAISFWNAAKGKLPHLYYILLNTEPLGTKLKTVACYVTGFLFLIDII